MKILQLANKNPFPPKDGGELAIKAMADNLASVADDFVLLMMTTSKHKKDETAYKTQTYRVENVPVEVPIRFDALLKNLLFSKIPYPIERFIIADYNQRLIDLLKEQEFDIVQLESLYLAPYIETIRAYNPQAKIVLRAHNVEHAIWQRNVKIERHFFKKIYLKFLAKRMHRYEQSQLKRIDAVVSISDIDFSILKGLNDNVLNGVVVPFGMDINRYQDISIGTQEPLNIAYLGALDWYPNQEGLKWFLEKVWRLFHEKHRELQFHIAGRRAPAELEQYFKAQAGVVYHGEIDDAEQYLKTYPVFITPLFSGSGMRVKLIEQMALKRLVVATSIAVEGIPATHEKELLIADDEKTMLALLDGVVKNTDAYHLMRQQAYDFVKKTYDNKLLMQKLMHFYADITKR